jgi:probable phosphoglycerate mutase
VLQNTTSPESVLELVLIRHGATEWSENGRHTGTTDLPLTELGKKQSELLKKRLEKEKFSKVFCSPLKRALETCQICGIQADNQS